MITPIGAIHWAARPSLLVGLVTLAISANLIGAEPSSATRYRDRWVYCATNLQVTESADRTIELIRRAARDGYTGLLLADYKLNVLDRVPEYYFPNIKRVQKAAAAAQIELIPAIFPIGYSNGLLSHDPNLAEGLPVMDQPFKVKNGVARLEPAAENLLKNGDFEIARGHKVGQLSFQDDPGIASFVDHDVAHHGKASVRLEPGQPSAKRSSPNVRLMQRLALRPHTAYRLSAQVKTSKLSTPGSFNLVAISPGRTLTFLEGGVESTQDWKSLEVAFNSLDQTETNIYIGYWGEGTGQVWVDELAVEELALVNLLRRPGCPLVVKSADGRTTYLEGRDFHPVADPKLGQSPWAGEFEFGHPGPSLRMTTNSRIREGDGLRISWYHPVVTHGSQIMCCLSEPKVDRLLEDQARRVNDLLKPKTFFMSHDEIRVANWCQACQSRKLTPGQLLAENARRCTSIIKRINPKARIVVWSDMFDPYHNAVSQYYLVNGSLSDSWVGLDRAVEIANWNSGKAAQSLGFFSKRGHRQIIAGYYDGDDLGNFDKWNLTASGVSGVAGFMYTTWQSKYDLLERYGTAIRQVRSQ